MARFFSGLLKRMCRRYVTAVVICAFVLYIFVFKNKSSNLSYTPSQFVHEEEKTPINDPIKLDRLTLMNTLMPSIGSKELNEGFRYEMSLNGKVYVGQAFDRRWKTYLDKLKLLDLSSVNDEKVLKSTPVFVSGFSSNHFHEAKVMLKLLMDRFKGEKKIYIYDIGLNPQHREELNSSFGGVIIEIRQFKFGDFPQYVSNLAQYRWKPLIVAEMLTEFPSIWWMDTSIRMLGPIKTVYSKFNTCDSSKLTSCPHYPWMTVDSGGHSIFAATEPNMFKYLPLPEQVAQNVTMFGANLQLIYGIRHAKENVLRFWVLCALQEDCMAPAAAMLYCRFQADRYKYYGHCHRYDQSAVNILLTWINGFNESRYHFEADKAFDVVRM